MRVLVLGAGAVGGYFGGRMANAGMDVTFLVREKKKRKLENTGLVIKSPKGDVSIKPNHVEVQNALAQVKKEIANRFDFKGTCAEVTSSDNEIICIGENEFQINQITDIIFTKFGKRGVDVRILNPRDMNKSANDKIKRIIDIANGISTDDAKKIVKAIKTKKLKVQSSINGQMIKVSGSKRDTLQETIEFLKKEFPALPLTFDNFRD